MKKFIATGAIAGLVIAASGVAAFAQSGGQLAVAQGTNTQTYDVPAGSKAQTVIITTRDLKDGETTSAHMHHGVEMTQVTSGTFGYSVGKSLAIAYLKTGLTKPGDEVNVAILGSPHRAVILATPAFDPEGKRLRA